MSEEIEIHIGECGRPFKSLTETYKMNTCLLALSLMYPNPSCDGKRKIIIGIFLVLLSPLLILSINDIRLRLFHGDMANLVRQTIILLSVSFIILKVILTVVRSHEMRAIFDGIDRDYEIYNNLPEEYQKVVIDTIKWTKLLEKVWVVIMAITACSYPAIAGVCTINSTFLTENPRRFMIHEISLMYLTDEEKYESPYFEIFAIYSIFIVWVVFVGFTGYEGMFAVCIVHASLKIKLINISLRYLVNTNDLRKINKNIAEFVTRHCEVARLIGEIQRCYEVWLASIFLIAIVQIGMALNQITTHAQSNSNVMYYFVLAATIVYIYLPCYLASDVTYSAAAVAGSVYDSSWELTTDVGVRKSICIIIARAQMPINFRALGMLTFNMSMFVSILQTAYSMYTLLRT